MLQPTNSDLWENNFSQYLNAQKIPQLFMDMVSMSMCFHVFWHEDSHTMGQSRRMHSFLQNIAELQMIILKYVVLNPPKISQI